MPGLRATAVRLSEAASEFAPRSIVKVVITGPHPEKPRSGVSKDAPVIRVLGAARNKQDMDAHHKGLPLGRPTAEPEGRA